MDRRLAIIAVVLLSLLVWALPVVSPHSRPVAVAAHADNPERVSRATGGTQANAASSFPSVSGDGRYVSFTSPATNLVSGDTNGETDIFVHDRIEHVTVRVSVASDGSQGSGGSTSLNNVSSISADGRFVAFDSPQTNLVSGDTNARQDVFVHDRDADADGIFDEPGAMATALVSVATDGTLSNSNSAGPAISADGRYVAIQSTATTFQPGSNGTTQIWVRDRDTDGDGIFDEPGAVATTRVSESTGGVQGDAGSSDASISGTGAFVAFSSSATNLVGGDTNGVLDVFRRDGLTGTTTRISQTSGGTEGNDHSRNPSISTDGAFVAFQSRAITFGIPQGSLTDIFGSSSGVLTTISLSHNGSTQNSSSEDASTSLTGRYTAFASVASNLVDFADSNNASDVFVRDRLGATTRMLSVRNADGQESNQNSANRRSPRMGW